MPKDVCTEVMFDAVDEFVRQGDSKKKTVTDIRFVNIDDLTVQAFGNEFMARHGNNCEKKITREGSIRLSPTGAEGGSSTGSRLNLGKNCNRNMPSNNRSTTIGSSANIDHPLSASGHSDASYSCAVKRCTCASDANSPKSDEPRGLQGRAGFSLHRGSSKQDGQKERR